MRLELLFVVLNDVQTGIISPSKLRMKLLGPHHHRKKDGSNSNSARTSPSRLDDAEFMKNSLLASETDNTDDQGLYCNLIVCYLFNLFLEELHITLWTEGYFQIGYINFKM